MQQVRNEILTYFLARPDAQDTVEGIAGWWLIEQRIEHCVTEVREALASLVAAGLVLEQQSGGPAPLYRLNRRRLDEIRTLLRNGEDALT